MDTYIPLSKCNIYRVVQENRTILSMIQNTKFCSSSEYLQCLVHVNITSYLKTGQNACILFEKYKKENVIQVS